MKDLLIGHRIKEIREELGMTQKQFSEMIGFTSASVSAYENNKKMPQLEFIVKIAEECKVSIDWLCGLAEQRTRSESLVTYSDVIKTISKISDSLYTDVDSITSGGERFKVIIIKDDAMQYFLKEWEGMLNLRREGTISQKLYGLWITDKMNEYGVSIGRDEFGFNPDLDVFLEEKRYGSQ